MAHAGQKRPPEAPAAAEDAKRQKLEDPYACIRLLTGIPENAEAEDVECWFEGYGLVEGGVQSVEGQWQVTFVSPEEAERAMERSGQSMGPNVIELWAAQAPPPLPTAEEIQVWSVEQLMALLAQYGMPIDETDGRAELQVKVQALLDAAASLSEAPPAYPEEDSVVEPVAPDAPVPAIAAPAPPTAPAAVAPPPVVPASTPTAAPTEEPGPKVIVIPKLDLKAEDIPDAPIGVTPKPPSITVQGELTDTLKGHTSWVATLALTSDGSRLVSGGADATLRVWCPTSRAELVQYTGHRGKILGACITSDDRLAVSTSTDKMVHVWELATGRGVRTWNGKTNVNGVAVAPDMSVIVTAGDDKCLRVWDFETLALRHNLKGHTGPVWAVTMTADGALIVSGGGDNAVRLWDAATGKSVATLTGHTGWVRCLAITPDGQHIISGGGDKAVRLWDIAKRQAAGMALKHTGAVLAVAVAPPGGHFATCGEDNTVRLWKTSGLELVATIKGHIGVVRAVAINPLHGTIMSGGGDQTIRFWSYPAELTAHPDKAA